MVDANVVNSSAWQKQEIVEWIEKFRLKKRALKTRGRHNLRVEAILNRALIEIVTQLRVKELQPRRQRIKDLKQARITELREYSTQLVGTRSGYVQVWDVAVGGRIEKMPGHSASVGALAWNGDVVSSGNHDGLILQCDMRPPSPAVERRLVGHTKKVCSLKWSADKKALATGVKTGTCIFGICIPSNLCRITLNIWQQ